MYPKNKAHNFLRVEYNPALLGKEGRIQLRTFLIELLGHDIVLSIYFVATVTRLDLTVDIFDMEPNLYPHKNRVNYSEIKKDEDTGGIQPHIIGSDLSNKRVTIYDKNAEQGVEKSNNYQRVEIRYRNLNCSMGKLSRELLNEFKTLNFFYDEFLTDSRFSRKFKRNASDNGLNSALKELNDVDKRRCYLRYLNDYLAEPHPIEIDDLNFELAHYEAFNSLVHRDFRDKTIINKYKSLLKGVKRPSQFRWHPPIVGNQRRSNANGSI
jgi:hypothetical protein